MIGRTRKKRVICFVDDDPNELRRFARAMEPRFDVVTGTGYAACRHELERRNRARPDLWVLDLYFPNDEHGPNSPAELTAMNAKYLKLHQATVEFHEFLNEIGQGVAGGLALIDKCKAAGGPVIMLTRKGTLEDAILCLDRGAAAVLRKPMPVGGAHDDDPEAIRQALDAAMLDSAPPLIGRLEQIIRANAHWARNRAAYLWWSGMAAGATLAWSAAYLLSFLAAQ